MVVVATAHHDTSARRYYPIDFAYKTFDTRDSHGALFMPTVRECPRPSDIIHDGTAMLYNTHSWKSIFEFPCIICKFT